MRNAYDGIPTAKAPRGKGPATKKQMKKRQRRIALDAKLEFAQPVEEKERPER